MSKFAEVAEALRTPGKTLILKPWMFADDWHGKPTTDVCVGLRLMSDLEKTKARGEAERYMLEVHPYGGDNAVDCFNDTLLRQVVALGICDPNDVMKPSDVLPLAEMQVREALTSNGAATIYEEIHRYEVEVSNIRQEATDDDLLDLVEYIESGDIHTAANASVVKRFLRYALDELRR